MRRFIAVLALVGIAVRVAAAAATPGIALHALEVPAGGSAMAPMVAAAPDGTAYLSWVEPSADGQSHALRTAVCDRTGAWRPTGAANGDKPVAPSGADIPQLAVDGRGTVYSIWRDGTGGAWWSASRDRAMTWTKPAAWSAPTVAVEKFSTVRLADGRVLAAWLQAPAQGQPAQPTRLFSRLVGIADQPDELIDPRVCDCCQIGLAPFVDTGALIAYRGRTVDEVRDIHVARRRYGKWSEPRVLNHDDWHIAACPVNGPRLGTDGSRVAAAWFTAAGNEPRVLA